MLVFAFRLTSALILCFVLTGTILAASGYVYPDTAHVSFSWLVVGDTVTAQLLNQDETAVQQTSFTDITGSKATLLSCHVDGVPTSSIPQWSLWGSISPSKYTTSWEIGDFHQSVTLRFVAPQYQPGNLSWMAFSGYAMFGLTDSAFTPGNCCVGTRGNINSDAQDAVDISDLVYYVEYMFRTPPGPAPLCREEADVSIDGGVDIADLVILVEFMFESSGGQLPACP